MTIEDLAGREGMTAAYIVRIVRLAFLSPTMLKSIIGGTLPAHLTRQATDRARCRARPLGPSIRLTHRLLLGC